MCIGDRYRIGGALFEVTQPRVTCYRLGIRMNEPQMAALVVAHHRPGFYFRVLEEGEVEAGDEIVKVLAGPERMTVAEIDALLYLPGRDGNGLERALRIPALSAGWRSSFETLLEQERKSSTAGNPALAPAAQPAPAWAGFRPLRVVDKRRESLNVTSLTLEPSDGRPLVAAMPGQFIVLRLKPSPEAPALLRSYSLSGEPSGERWRLGVKREPNGAAGAYIEDGLKVGDVIDSSAPRGAFLLTQGDGPLVLLSAGIGSTPVLAMLHALAAGGSRREIWWVHGARNGAEHAFAAEAPRASPDRCPEAIATSVTARPALKTVRASISMAPGALDARVLQELGAPREADFYLCGPAAFMSALTADLMNWGVSAERLHSENFGSGPSLTPGVVATPPRPPHLPDRPTGAGPMVSFARSNLTLRWDSAFQSLLELAEACDVPVRWACRTGVCHNCETGLIAGAVDYFVDPLTPPAEGDLLICCSRPRADVVLDL